jgi:type IV pilus assembly protein PilO
MRGHVDRLWAIGGVLGAVALLAIAWFFLIGPRNSESSSLREQARTTENRLQPLAARLVELRQQNTELSHYQQQVAADRQALPTTSGLPDFLRGLQTSGETAGATVTGVTVAAATKVTAGGRQLVALPITLTAAGGLDNLNRFLDQLQQVQPRAVLITNTDLTKTDQSGSGGFELTIDLQVFVAPAA